MAMNHKNSKNLIVVRASSLWLTSIIDLRTMASFAYNVYGRPFLPVGQVETILLDPGINYRDAFGHLAKMREMLGDFEQVFVDPLAGRALEVLEDNQALSLKAKPFRLADEIMPRILRYSLGVKDGLSAASLHENLLEPTIKSFGIQRAVFWKADPKGFPILATPGDVLAGDGLSGVLEKLGVEVVTADSYKAVTEHLTHKTLVFYGHDEAMRGAIEGKDLDVSTFKRKVVEESPFLPFDNVGGMLAKLERETPFPEALGMVLARYAPQAISAVRDQLVRR